MNQLGLKKRKQSSYVTKKMVWYLGKVVDGDVVEKKTGFCFCEQAAQVSRQRCHLPKVNLHRDC